MELKNPDIRKLNDMKEVLYDQEWAKNAPNLELYFMYRGIEYKDGLRYDITEIPFQMLGQEFTKTKGHKHPGKFSELYQVLEGQAIFLMQKIDNGKVVDVYAIKAKKDDKVFIPAHYGHVTINPGPEDLKMSNWVADGFENQGKLEWIKNEKYGELPELRFEEPNQSIPKNLTPALLGN